MRSIEKVVIKRDMDAISGGDPSITHDNSIYKIFAPTTSSVLVPTMNAIDCALNHIARLSSCSIAKANRVIGQRRFSYLEITNNSHYQAPGERAGTVPITLANFPK
ncbi:hypothetical protein ACFONN_21225 [Dyella humi]|uniref:Uncharacterized protein n=1 Tax=Dyella humi TaxID=1770547 RepID=A0ABW8IFC8_9GAMM